MKNKLYTLAALPLLAIVLLCSCGNGANYSPKPRGYFRIDLAEKSYVPFDTTYPYRFQYPAYGKVEPLKKDGEQYWMNLDFPRYKATIYLSYKRVNGNLAELIEDTHKMSYRHSVKADAIAETPYINDSTRVYGLITEIAGDAASPVQFYLTDSTKNFLRGSLYFYATPNRDSLDPLIKYFTADIQHLMETTEWKKNF